MRRALPTVSARRRRPRRGVAATEFALILPLLTTVVLGGLDFGRFAYHYIAVTNSARAGAAFGCMKLYTTATQGEWQVQLRQAAVDEIDGQTGFTPDQLTVTATKIVETGGLWRIQVVASYPFETLVAWPGIPRGITLRRTVVLRGIR